MNPQRTRRHEPVGRMSRRRTVIAAVLATALALGVLGGTVALLTHDTSSTPPSVNSSPVLNLTRTSNGASSTNAAASVAGAGFSGYQLDGTLSTDTGEGVVVDPSGSTATQAQIDALLSALGASSLTAKQVDGGWTAEGTVRGEPANFALDERAGNVWQYVRGAQGGCLSISPGAAPDAAISCGAVASAVTPPTSGTAPDGTATVHPTPAEPPSISRADLVAQAAALFTLVGVQPGNGLQSSSGGGVTYLDVPLTVEGLPVVDVTLSVAGDATGLVSASGWLDPSFAPVGKYPLISARAGYDDLLAQPQPAIGIAQPYCGKDGCPTPAPQKVTAARLAWLTSRTDDHVVLVPAWQYEVDGFYGPAVVAIAPQYLATPTPAPGPTNGSGAATGPSASSAPGSAGGGSPEPNPVSSAGPPDAVPPTPLPAQTATTKP